MYLKNYDREFYLFIFFLREGVCCKYGVVDFYLWIIIREILVFFCMILDKLLIFCFFSIKC